MAISLTKKLLHLIYLLVIFRQILLWRQAVVDAQMDLRIHDKPVMNAPEGLTLVCCDYPALLCHKIILLILVVALVGVVFICMCNPVCSCFICVHGRVWHVDLEV